MSHRITSDCVMSLWIASHHIAHHQSMVSSVLFISINLCGILYITWLELILFLSFPSIVAYGILAFPLPTSTRSSQLRDNRPHHSKLGKNIIWNVYTHGEKTYYFEMNYFYGRWHVLRKRKWYIYNVPMVLQLSNPIEMQVAHTNIKD